MAKFNLAVFNTQPPHLYFGGVERRIMETTKRLQAEADVTIYSGTKAGFKASTNINGSIVVPCKSTDRVFPLDNFFFNRSLTKDASTLKADVYEAHAVSAYGLPAKLNKLGVKKPFIHTIHGVLADEYEQAKMNGHQTLRGSIANRFMRYLASLEKQTAKNATLIVTISEYSLEKMQQYYDVDADKIRIVSNGVDIEEFKPIDNVSTTKHQFGLGNEQCILFVGSLIPRKGLAFLIEAAKKVVAVHADTKFIVVGDGPLRGQIDSSLKAANLTNNFKFIRSVEEDELPTLYNLADIFVLPSIQEGQGIVLLEAQASGKPVVAFNTGGVKEAVRNGKTGLLVERGDNGGLAEGLLKLLDNKSLREEMGAEGRRFVSENFTWDICAQRMLKVYHEAISD